MMYNQEVIGFFILNVIMGSSHTWLFVRGSPQKHLSFPLCSDVFADLYMFHFKSVFMAETVFLCVQIYVEYIRD